MHQPNMHSFRAQRSPLEQVACYCPLVLNLMDILVYIWTIEAIPMILPEITLIRHRSTIQLTRVNDANLIMRLQLRCCYTYTAWPCN